MRRNVKAYDAEPGSVLKSDHPNVENRNGYYGYQNYDRKGNCIGFTELGSEMILERIEIDIDTFVNILQLSFNTGAGLNIQVDLNRGDLTETGILKLAEHGCQVSKDSAPVLIKVIENQESPDIVDFCYENIGWGYFQKNLIFKGYKCIGFEAKYKGQLAIKPTGKFSVWKAMVEKSVLGNERLEAALSFGFSAVLLDFLKRKRDVENIIISMCGESTTGKSTSGFLALSTGCYPDFDKDSLALTFLSTENALINSLSENSGYPVLIDEASLSKSKNFTSLIYTVSQGKEKARLNKDCTRKEPGYFSTTAIITTETSILNGAEQNTGLYLRCLEFYGVVWTNDAESAEEIKSVIHNNYGHAIPKIAQYLLDKINDGSEDQIFERYDYWRSRFVTKAKEEDNMNGFIDRFAKKLAVIMTGVEVAREALGIDFNLEEIFAFVDTHNQVKDIKKMDIGNRAYDFLLQSVFANSSKFRKPAKNPKDLPVFVPTEFWGVIEEIDPIAIKMGGFASKQIKIMQKYFDKIIYEGGFNDPKIVSGKLKESGLLACESDRRISDFDITGNGDYVKGYIIRVLDVSEKKDEESKKTVTKKKV